MGSRMWQDTRADPGPMPRDDAIQLEPNRPMRLRRLLPLASGIALALLACGESSPTETGSTVRILMNVHGTAKAPTIVRASLSWDGGVVNTFQPATPVRDLALASVLQGVRPGRHTLTVTILGQTASPGEYTSSGSVFVGDRRIVVQERRGRLDTGEGLTASLDL